MDLLNEQSILESHI